MTERRIEGMWVQGHRASVGLIVGALLMALFAACQNKVQSVLPGEVDTSQEDCVESGSCVLVEGTSCTKDDECSGVETPICRLAFCEPNRGQCALKALEDATACSSADACFTDETCQAGVCRGAPIPPTCGEKVCGFDACFNECGGCKIGLACTQAGQCAEAPADIPLTAVKAFICSHDGSTADVFLGELLKMSGEKVSDLKLRASEVECKFRLVEGNGPNATLINSEPMAPALVEGRVFADSTAILCFSDVQHEQPEQVKNDPSLPRVHLITGVVLACVGRVDGVWGEVASLMDTQETWAGWIKGLEPHPDDAGALVLTYARDFTFNFLNYANAGRPESDGTYQLVVRLAESGKVEADAAPIKISDKVAETDEVELGEYAPTAEEREEFGEFLAKEGDCPPPNGCPNDTP